MRGDRYDLREAVGERAADQPLEPARDCRRSDTTRSGSKHLAALGGAVFKKEADLKPHRFRYWLTPKPDPAFDAKCADICEVYQAAAGADDSHRTVSIDEMTGIQALERAAPGLPMKPGKVERREFEYIRHGTCSFILSRDVVSGQVLAPYAAPTRTEAEDKYAKLQDRVDIELGLSFLQGLLGPDIDLVGTGINLRNIAATRAMSFVNNYAGIATTQELRHCLRMPAHDQPLRHKADSAGTFPQ